MTEEELKCDGWEPRLCRVGRLYFNEPYFCRLDGETVILFSTTDDMHPIGQAKTLDDIKQLQMSHEAEELKALENTLVLAKQLFFEKYGNRERSLTAKEILEEIKGECNRRMDELWDRLPDAHIVEEDKYTRDDAFVTGQYNTLEEILRRIESMEKKTSDSPESEDVDEAARKWEDKTYLEKGYQDAYGTPHAPFSEIGNAFIAGAKWQERKDNICYEEIFEEGVRWANERTETK